MKTKKELNDKIRKLKQKTKEEISNLKKEFEIMQQLKPLNYDISIHLSYIIQGQAGTISFFDKYNGTRADLKQLKTIIDKFRPVKVYKDSNSFRPNNDESRIEVCPIMLKVENCTSEEVKVVYYTQLMGEYYQINIYVSRSVYLNWLYVTYDRNEFKGGYSIDNTILHKKGVLCGWDYIKWARGSKNYPNDFTIYNTNVNYNYNQLFEEKTEE